MVLIDIRQLDANEIVTVTTRPDIGTSAGYLNRNALIQNHGLLPTLARQLMTRLMKIRLGMTGSTTSVSSVVVNVGGRLLSD